MNMSHAGLAALHKREGIVLKPYKDSAGLWTIGCGHLLTKDELSSGKLTALGIDWRKGITRAQADALLQRDLATAECAVESGVKVALTPGQFDTLVSFVFNVGVNAFLNSTLLRLLNAGDYASVPVQLKRWKYSAGRVDPVLVNRRDDEIKQWKAAS